MIDSQSSSKKKGKMKTWVLIMSIYLVVLMGIGYVAFSKQYFNDAESIAGQFLELRKKYDLSEGEVQVLDELMKKSADSSSDLQELASQSFNITLGALLAFLSGSATVFFNQNKDQDNAAEV